MCILGRRVIRSYEVLGEFLKFYMKKKNIKRYVDLHIDKSTASWISGTTRRGRLLNNDNVNRLLDILKISKEEAREIALEMKEIENGIIKV